MIFPMITEAELAAIVEKELQKTRERHARETDAIIAAIQSQHGEKNSRETLRKMRKIWKMAKAGDEKAQKIVALLDEKAVSIDKAYKVLFKPEEKEVGLYVKIPAQMRKLIWHISDTTGAQVNTVVNEALMSYLTQIFGE